MLVSASHPFCVYTHAIDDVIFYVGKGEAYRAFSRRNRNRLWAAKTSGRAFDVEIVSRHESDLEAVRAELALIRQLKPECNMIHNGLTRSAEVKAALSKAHLGRKHSDETKERMRARRIANVALGVKAGRKAMPVKCIDSGEVFASIADAARATGLQATKIRLVIHGKRETTGGYRFRHANWEQSSN